MPMTTAVAFVIALSQHAAASEQCCEHTHTTPVIRTIETPIKPLCLHADHPHAPERDSPDGPLQHTITEQEARQIIAQRGTPASIVGPSDQSTGGLQLRFTVYGETSPDTDSALQLVADYYAGIIGDPITIDININFMTVGLGGTLPTIHEVSYANYVSALRRDADADDILPDLLPRDGLPLRRELAGAITTEREILITSANAKAVGLLDPDSGTDAEMFIGNRPDGNPADGLGNGAATGFYSDFSLVDILVHEVGHALGFFNAVDLDIWTPTSLDLFRFARNGAENPSTPEEFTDFPRAFFLGYRGPEQEHNFDFLIREHAASNGSQYQVSHFEETGIYPDRVGVMEPAIAPFETGFPDYFSAGDTDALDAIGWDIVIVPDPIPCTAADFAEPMGVLDLQDIVAFVEAFGDASAVADLSEPQGILDLSDIVAFVDAFAPGCP